MPKTKPCPAAVKKAGAELVKARRMAADLAEQIIIARAAVKATIPELKRAGAREMEAGAGLARLMEAAMAEGLIGAAHDSFRSVLARCGFAEPTDNDILSQLDGGVSAMGGGGSRRGGR